LADNSQDGVVVMSVECSTSMSQLGSKEADGIPAVGYHIREAGVSIEPQI
jgi:hypothetical protein